VRTLRETAETAVVRSDARVDELWERAIQVLSDFVEKDGTRPAPRRAFWKRS
jgi:hypothetical protein